MARLYTEVDVRRMIEEATAALRAPITELEAQPTASTRDSSTSSKSPSSDIAKPPRSDADKGTRRQKKRQRGGQPGHPWHERLLFPPEEVDKICCYEWTEASSLREWEPLDQYQTVQQ